MEQQTVVYCVGAQKAGSSWLFTYLVSHPDCRMSNIKEMHYFDFWEEGKLDKLPLRVEEKRLSAVRKQEKGASKHNHYPMAQHFEKMDRFLDLIATNELDVERYVDLLKLHTGGAKIVGEATPAYSTLEAALLRRIYEGSKPSKFIFVMRDPVSRLWSQARMIAGRETDGTASAMVARATEVLDGFLERATEGDDDKRSNYRRSVQNLDSSIPAEDLHYEFYEALFDPEGEQQAVRRICAFLGIQEHPPRMGRVLNKGVEVKMPEEFGRRAMGWLRPQYSFVEERFGTLPQRWRDTIERFG
ncbi:MAG: sulfotransferase [Pseudomonadota bacterium]